MENTFAWKRGQKMKYLRAFSEISKDDIDIAGGKGANLGEMSGAGIPVPAGAVLTAMAYDIFIPILSS